MRKTSDGATIIIERWAGKADLMRKQLMLWAPCFRHHHGRSLFRHSATLSHIHCWSRAMECSDITQHPGSSTGGPGL